MDDIAKKSMLYDCYAELLTEKMREVMELHYEDDLSISEIAEELGISRAAVHDSLKNAEKKLIELESRLGLVKRIYSERDLAERASVILDRIEEAAPGAKKETEELRSILRELAEEQEEE